MANKMEAMRAKQADMASKASEAKNKARDSAAKAQQAKQSAMASKAQSQRDSAAKAQQAKQAQAQSQKSAMAGQAKPYTDALDRAIKAKQAAPARPAGGMGGGMKAALDKAIANRPAPARPTERIPRPAGTVSPNAAKMVGKPLGGTPARPMGSMFGSKSFPAPARPAMTPQVKQNLLDMSNKLRAMPMKKGGKAGKK